MTEHNPPEPLGEDFEDHAPPLLPDAVVAAIASWWRVLGATQDDKRPNFKRASVELLRLAATHDNDVRHDIIDTLHAMAVRAEIDPDEAQAIMAAAKDAPPDGRANGEHQPKSGEHRLEAADKPPELPKLEFLDPTA